jgi:hypothetical protein
LSCVERVFAVIIQVHPCAVASAKATASGGVYVSDRLYPDGAGEIELE